MEIRPAAETNWFFN